jgi:hypothetical protein
MLPGRLDYPTPVRHPATRGASAAVAHDGALAHRQPRRIGEAPGSRNDGGLAGRAAAQLALHRAQRQQPQPDARATSKPLNLGSLPNSHEIAIDFQEIGHGASATTKTSNGIDRRGRRLPTPPDRGAARDEQLDAIECESAEAALATCRWGSPRVAMIIADVRSRSRISSLDFRAGALNCRLVSATSPSRGSP